jgi:Fe-S oxidoreductase
VVHATEFLARLIDEGKLTLPSPVGRKVTYHDPCYLGRQSEPPLIWAGEYRTTHGCMTYPDPPREINRGVRGVFDEPRRILRTIQALDFVEMARIREYAFCCGGGGGVPQAYPELARNTALHRLEEAADVGAECLVTACHHCRANFTEAQGSAKDALPVVDIIDLVYEASGIGS